MNAAVPRRFVRRLAVVALAVATAFAGLVVVMPAAHASPAVQFTNPLAEQRADPHIFKHTDGFYYFTATVPEYDRIVLRRATTIQGLASAPETVIWRKHATGEMGAHIWAPEIHFINGKWYVYFTAGRSDDKWRIRMYVLETADPNPITGTWVERGRIVTPWDTFSLDETTFVANGVRYLSWAQAEPGADSSIYIARMGADPWTITGTVTKLTSPTLAWETRRNRVNEGPAVIQRDGRIFLTYSASATDANYCLGMLSASSTADLLNPSSWTKSQTPVFASNDATSQYGPGHNSFTVSEDGQSDILVYHDRSYRDIVGDPLLNPDRRTRVQKIYWNADGTPNFGIPVADGVTPVRLKSYNFPDRFVRHWEYRARVEANVNPLADSQFRIVTGLNGSGTVSLESTNFPGYYLRHRNYEFWVQRDDGTALFKNDASFFQRAGLADSSAVSFEAQNFPGRYLRHNGTTVNLTTATDTVARADSTFILE
ncbi:alpha-arabinofuranosidase [Saccharothrix sp. ALI-22-I]|uniref:family 43 glycosylhydrolase n=1 Tax=Saccharothrix sp. ALI-22-I TaxID=1933778 RepID=UPI00097C9216|nr:family 43 glycosylhydrolase [Saccharothrix sp. ALI-22-I]ONI93118.1 alpha-arabinofuranosidase [Saccharothrix sp. ALI-22-I]